MPTEVAHVQASCEKTHYKSLVAEAGYRTGTKLYNRPITSTCKHGIVYTFEKLLSSHAYGAARHRSRVSRQIPDF